jgi:hypothetical protein
VRRLFVIFLSLILVYQWYADKIGVCVALAVYLWEHRNIVWLFEHMLLLVECIEFVLFFRQESIVLNGEVGMFCSVGLCKPHIPCNSQDDFHHRGYIRHHEIFLFGGVGLSSSYCAFHTSRF